MRACRWATISEQKLLFVFPVHQSIQLCIECLQVIKSEKSPGWKGPWKIIRSNFNHHQITGKRSILGLWMDQNYGQCRRCHIYLQLLFGSPCCVLLPVPPVCILNTVTVEMICAYSLLEFPDLGTLDGSIEGQWQSFSLVAESAQRSLRAKLYGSAKWDLKMRIQ